MSVEWNDHLERWTAVYSDPASNCVVLRTSPELTGPWSSEAHLFDAVAGHEQPWVYDAVLHPEYAEDDGRIQYISHSRLTGEGFLEAELRTWRVEFH